jgi:fumarylacetoacetase
MHEMRPLGSFNAKAVGTSISPWIVIIDALEEAGAVLDIGELIPGAVKGGKWTDMPLYISTLDVDIEIETYIRRTSKFYYTIIS